MEDNGRLIKHEINVKATSIYDGSACRPQFKEQMRARARARPRTFALACPSSRRDSISRKAN